MAAKIRTAQVKATERKKPKTPRAPKKTAKKKPTAPKAPRRTAAEKWFLALDRDHFRFYAKQWNEENLQVKLPDLDGYDAWFNYFATLSPSIIKQLAITGVDFLPTDGYAALSRWHDIITHPGRIDKVHQAGLARRSTDKNAKSILELAQSNDRLGVLKATRDRIAEKLEKGAGARDTAALAREMTEVMTQIEYYEKRQGPKKTTKLGQLLGDVDLRKRPSQNGGGSRHTSFKSRVTIREVESRA